MDALVINQRLCSQMHFNSGLCIHQCLWLLELEKNNHEKKLLSLQFTNFNSSCCNLPRIEFSPVYHQFSNSVIAPELNSALHTVCCHVS